MANVLILEGRGGTGTLEFPVNPRKYPMGYVLKFDKRDVRQEIDEYLNTKRVFWIPESEEIDDYRKDNAKPTDFITYFWLAVCELASNTGVFFKES